MNEMKYIWMNEADSVFAKKGSLVKVSYVGTSFWDVLILSLWFQDLLAYDQMMWNILCAIWNMLCTMCKMLSDVYNMIPIMMHVLSWHDIPK